MRYTEIAKLRIETDEEIIGSDYNKYRLNYHVEVVTGGLEDHVKLTDELKSGEFPVNLLVGMSLNDFQFTLNLGVIGTFEKLETSLDIAKFIGGLDIVDSDIISQYLRIVDFLGWCREDICN